MLHRYSVPILVRATRCALGAVPAAAFISGTGCNALPSVRWSPAGSVTRDIVLALPAVDLDPHRDHHAAAQPAPLQTTAPFSGWIHGYTIEVVDRAGDTVPGVVLHHVKVLAPGRRELFMPIALRLAGAGAETRKARLPRWLGVPVQQGDSLLVTAMVHNPTPRRFEGVGIRVRLHATLARGTAGVTAVYPFFLHVTPPHAASEYDLPPGYSERSWEARPAVHGRIVALGGHLHRYGTMLRLENLTTGQEMWRTHARSDTAGDVVDIPRTIYRWSRGPRIHAGHVYRVTASYFNPTADTIRGGGMGTVGGAFRPGAAWPGVDRRHPLYGQDLERERNGHALAGAGSRGAPSHHH